MVVSCEDDETADLNSAIYPKSITLQVPENVKPLIYKDENGTDVLPLLKGEEVKLGYVMLPEEITFDEVAWTSSDESVAEVTPEGMVKAVNGNGETYSVIQVSPSVFYSGSGIYSALKVMVSNEMKKAESISLEVDAEEVYMGEQVQMHFTLLPEDATYKTVKWSSSDENIATVDDNGVVTAKPIEALSKTVTITASSFDGSEVSASKELTILKAVQPENIEINQIYSADQGYGCAITEKTLKLKYTTTPADCTTSLIEWTSSDENIATVEQGVVTFNQEGHFGEVTITATCPETGNKSSIKLNLEAGLIRELFHDKDNYNWYNAKQSGNGTSSSHVWEYGKLTITTYAQNATTQRADLKCWSPKTWIHAGNRPILAVRMEDVKDKYKANGVTGRNISIDTSGKCNGVEYKKDVGGNNGWLHDYKCSDGSHVFIYDLSKQKFSTGGLLPSDAVAEFTTFQFKYADIKPISKQIEYSVYWIQTFKKIEDVQQYIESEGLSYEVIK